MKDVQEQEDLLPQYNIYDATPDHSILKHGMAKSLSNFHLGKNRVEMVSAKLLE